MCARRHQRVGRDVVVGMAQVVGREEHEAGEDDQEDDDAEAVLHRVVGMERHGVLRTLGVDAERVVRAVDVQRHDMQRHHADDDERQQVVQREEAVERRVVDREAAPQPGHDRLADHRDGREQVGDDGGAPEAHLAPRQHVAHERGRHHQQQDDDAQDPQQLARRLVGAVVHAAEDVDVDGDEEERRAVHVQVAHQPALRHVAHDALDRVEGHQSRAACSSSPARCR